MSTADNRRTGQPRQQRARREPLFPLEAEDIAPRERRGPPSPLRDLVGDIDEEMPTRVDLPRRQASRPRAEPAAPPLRREEPPAPRRAPQAEPARPAPQVEARVRSQPRPMRVAEPDDALMAARIRHDESEAALRRAELLTAQPYRSYSAPQAPTLPGLNRWLIMAVVMLASLVVIVGLKGAPSAADLSRWGAALSLSTNATANEARVQLFTAARPAGDYTLQSGPSITAQQIDAILAAYGSPAAGTGAAWYNLGLKYGIDPAFAVAFFIHESSAGTNPAWAGIKPGGATTYNVGNIICAGYATCYGRFRDYGSWDEGIEDWYRLIDVEYIQGRGTKTVQDIVPIYAPSFENDVQAYINSVTNLIDGWRTNGVN